MSAQAQRPLLSLDPLIAEAKRRARRRRWLGVLGLVVVVAATTVALGLRSGSGSGMAAVGPRPVIHIVTETPPRTVYLNLKTGRRERSGTYRLESWTDRRSGRNRETLTQQGRVVSDQVWTDHFGPRTEAAAVTNFYLRVATGLRAALRAGKAELVGQGTFNGHRIDWLRVRQTALPSWRHGKPWPQASEAVGVNTRSYKPILIRWAGGKHYSYTRILVAKAIPYDPTDFKSYGPKHPPISARQIPSGFAFGSTNPSASRGTVRAPWLTAGNTVAGLKLLAVKPFTIRRSKHHFHYGARNPKQIHGLELVYGQASVALPQTLPTLINLYGPQWEPRATTRLTTIYEVPKAPRVPPWSSVPDGSIQVQTGLTTIGNHVVPTLQIGYLKQHGLYITIRTPESQDTALLIARGLHAGPK